MPQYRRQAGRYWGEWPAFDRVWAFRAVPVHLPQQPDWSKGARRTISHATA